jgi:hypothetical protein
MREEGWEEEKDKLKKHERSRCSCYNKELDQHAVDTTEKYY